MIPPPVPDSPPPIGVLLVEDHPAMREGLRAAIACQLGMRVAGEAGTWHEALRLARLLAPDVLVLDLNLPDGNGWSLLEQLRSLKALPPTLVLSVCDEALYARRLLRAGARGYLMKDEPIGSVLQAIRDVHAGRLVASRELSSELMTEALDMAERPEADDPSAAAGELSDRELQVLGLIARRMSNKEIAASLGLSEKTVHTYKTRLMNKLGVRTTPELEACHAAWQRRAEVKRET
jgi:DNA-binding NarL/FixJ family response regulator